MKKYDEEFAVKKTQKEIAKELGIPPSTLGTVLKSRPEIEQNGLVWGSKGQKVKHGKYEELEKVLLEWFQQAHSLNYPVNGGVITEKAKHIAARLSITNFVVGLGG